MNKYHNVEEVSFSKDKMSLKIDGKEYSFILAEISKRLSNAGREERENYEISPAGYGIHWPAIDEDLSIDGLIKSTQKDNIKKESISA
jgi:hypothetical protein